ncbi:MULTISPECIES: hypothetical protein [Streptomyces]|jgi:hypothetical protein|nr:MULTISPECIES: hypothetical protein [Streptomyces]
MATVDVFLRAVRIYSTGADATVHNYYDLGVYAHNLATSALP